MTEWSAAAVVHGVRVQDGGCTRDGPRAGRVLQVGTMGYRGGAVLYLDLARRTLALDGLCLTLSPRLALACLDCTALDPAWPNLYRTGPSLALPALT